MARWAIEYYDEGAQDFVEFTGYNLNQVYEEMGENGEPHLYFYVFNTAANRALLQQDLLINAYYDDVLQFTGILQGGDIEDRPGKIKMVAYDDFIITLDQASSFTGAYEKPAKDIIDAILSGTGYSAHSSTPTTTIPVIFYHANRLDAIKFMQKALACDVWHDGTTVYFGSKGAGVTHTPTTIVLSKRGIDRSKEQFTKVEIRGTDVTGFHILGVAGSGTKVWKGNEDQMTDQATLNAIAAKKLAELSTDSSGLPVSVLMTEGKNYQLGESVAVSDARYLLDGTYRIMQMTKTKLKCNMQLDRARKTIAATVDELKGWEQKGIYTPGSEAWAINLQGLVGLFHLNEAEGTVAKNRAPIDTPIDGTINDGAWQDGPITKMLTLNGTSANISLGTASQAGINLTNKLSFGGWFSPSANDSTKRFVCHKDGQFALYYYVNTGVLGCDIVTSTGTHSFSSDAGLVKVGGRIFAMITYDQSKVRMYYNGWLHKEWPLTGAPSSSANTVYLGVFLKGVLAEVMLWSRALVDQEVLELYFFPLLRVVGGGSDGSSTSKWYCAVSTDARYGQVSPNGLQAVNVGSDLTLQAYRYDQHVFSKWLIDVGMESETESNNNPYVFPSQTPGTTHTAWAVFTPALPKTPGIPLAIDLSYLTFIQTDNYQGTHGIYPGKFFEILAGSLQTSLRSFILENTELTPIHNLSTEVSWQILTYPIWLMHSISSGVNGTTNPKGNLWYQADLATDFWDAKDTDTLSLQVVHPAATTKYSAVGQCFTGDGGQVTYVRFRISKLGSPVGNLKAAIYSLTGTFGSTGKPTGFALATSDAVATASLNDKQEWVDFLFSSPCTTVNGAKYCVFVYVESAATLDTSNYVKVSRGNVSPVHAGNFFYFYNSAWIGNSTYDVMFTVFKTTAAGVSSVEVTSYPNTDEGFVVDSANPFLWDNFWACGEVDASGEFATITVSRQIAYSAHRLDAQYVKGWGIVAFGTTSDGYRSVDSAYTTSYTRGSSPPSGFHSQWYIDGIAAGTSSSQVVAAQTDGTFHTVLHDIQPD